ncbi:MAG TPA: cytochrome c biogenesis protein CcdA [Verrucomicrobiae bacterium]|nr:cytochrome c biogenesis protein CcdA [Verrucomicrobiae bacterium]
MRRHRSWMLPLCLAVSAATGQPAADTPKITLAPRVSVNQLSPGASFQIAVVVELGEPWHVNANPASAPEFIPTVLTFEPSDTVTIDNIVYPKGKATSVSWADEPVALYTGRIVIIADGRVHQNAPLGPVRIVGSLRYQACDDSVCLAPKSVPISIETQVATGPAAPTHQEIFTAAQPPPPTSAKSSNQIERLIQDRGWFFAFFVVFLGGLALNLTPCVYPMIAITVSYFGGQGAQRSTGRAFVSSLIYCLGIVLTYSALGLAAALTGSLFGSALQSPVVLIGIAALLVALALSMFGLYELQPPQFLMQKATGLSSKAGYVGVFFLGAVIGVIAAPCLAPFVVALLAFVGQSGKPLLGWWLFFVFGCGLGLPYVILGTYSGALARLPKSGTWMVWVKRALGVVLIGVAIWFVSPLIGSKTADTSSPIAWQPYSAEAVASADKPVLIDFAADWCIPCKEMDKRTFSDQRVIEKSKQFRMLKADLTQTGSPEVDALASQFKILGVPTTVFLDKNGREYTTLRQVGYVPADEFVTIMNTALASPTATNLPSAAALFETPAELIRP